MQFNAAMNQLRVGCLFGLLSIESCAENTTMSQKYLDISSFVFFHALFAFRPYEFLSEV